MNVVEVDQIAEALGTSVCALLAGRLRNVAGSAFQQALDANEDLSQVVTWLSQASDLLEASTWAEVDKSWRSAVSAMRGQAASVGRELLETSVESAVASAKATVAGIYQPLRSAKNVYLVCSDGTTSDVTTTWRVMQTLAAEQSSTTAEAFMASYSETLATAGVGVTIGDSGVRDLSGAIRSAAYEAQLSAADDINRAAALSVGMDACQISAHAMCASDHLPYQGKVYTLTELDRLNESLPRPIGRGVMNCRHSLLYCYSGSSSTYSASELAALSKASTKSVTFTGASGKTLTKSAYEATQYMRSTESSIRKLKQAYVINQAAGVSTSSLSAAISSKTAYYESLCSELGETYSTSRITAYTMADFG